MTMTFHMCSSNDSLVIAFKSKDDVFFYIVPYITVNIFFQSYQLHTTATLLPLVKESPGSTSCN